MKFLFTSNYFILSTMQASHSQAPRRDIKALLCQINPIYKDKAKTIERIQTSLQRYSEKDKIDIVVFPELTFSGYNFKNHEDALPMAVRQHQGREFEFARKLALQMKTYVAFGYMEKIEDGDNCILYNSAAVLDREGVLILNYRKTHLYFNDKFWAKEGSGFPTFTLKTTAQKELKCTLGICMDINPKDFTSGKYELADHMVQTNSDVLVFITNWVDSEKDTIHKNDVAATYQYWIQRLSPVVLAKRPILVLVADRVGLEFDYFAKRQTRFYGSSTAIMLNPHKVLSNLDIENEGFLVIDTYL